MNIHKHLLELPMSNNDANARTVGEYLRNLLHLVLKEQEGFNGKRPFGNSCWIDELAIPFVKFDIIKGTYENEGAFVEYNENDLQEVLAKLLDNTFKVYTSSENKK